MDVQKLTIQQIEAKAQGFWATDDATVEDATRLELVPSILKRLNVSRPHRTICAVRMHVAEYVADEMMKKPISREQMSDILKKDEYWFKLSQKVDKSYPTAKWIENIAPLCGGGAFLIKFGAEKRYPLHPVVAKAISLGVLGCDLGTNQFTFVSLFQQIREFRDHCIRVQTAQIDARPLIKRELEKTLHDRLEDIKRRDQ